MMLPMEIRHTLSITLYCLLLLHHMGLQPQYHAKCHCLVQTEKGARPSFAAKPVGPSSKNIGGAATIPSTNVKVETAAPESASAFDDEHGSSAKVISSSGSALSLEEEDGSHHEENRQGIHTERSLIERHILKLLMRNSLLSYGPNFQAGPVL